MCECVVMLRSPERQEAGFKQDGSQSPLDLLVVNQLGRFQTRVVGGETEAGVQHLVHPGRLEALIPGSTVKEGYINSPVQPAPRTGQKINSFRDVVTCSY